LFEETESKEDQARMILEGSAYYDVEGKDGEWIRILCELGDLLIIPQGRNFRMTTTPKVSSYSRIKKELNFSEFREDSTFLQGYGMIYIRESG
jgi:cupin superfamily acireductone dioxygenase involved in methionine salvage